VNQAATDPDGTAESCGCRSCRNACTEKPGWFLPGEAEIAAESLGMTLPEFFAKYLAVDWWEGSPDIFLLSPAVLGEEAGTEFPGDPRGTCVFLEEGRCRIHPVKPHECRMEWHGDSGDSYSHEGTAMAWKDHQGQVTELLGREPEASPFYGGGLLGLFGSMGL
jgi:Fe-S-cluster containining protein